MTAHEIATRMVDMAMKTKDDRLSNALTRLANRLVHQGALFESPLTVNEFRIVRMFMTDPNQVTKV